MDKRNFAFTRMNYILLAIGMAIVIIGFLLMSGPGSTEAQFNPDIFSFRRVKLAPAVCFIGFLSMIFAVMYRPKEDKSDIVLTETATEPAVQPEKKDAAAEPKKLTNDKK